MLREFFDCERAGVRLSCFAWFGLFVFLGHQGYRAFLKFQINRWFGTFYDLLGDDFERGSGELSSGERGELADRREEVWRELWKFCMIVAPAVAIHPLAHWFRNVWVFAWRKKLMESYIQRWPASKEPIEGASQRIHEDTQRFASGIHSCVAALLDAAFTLAVFAPVLYGLDPLLMWVAFAAAFGGVGISAVVGKHLVGLEVMNQAAEAAFRRELVLMETKSAEQSKTPKATFSVLIFKLHKNYMALYRNFAALSTWLGFFDQSATILPYLLVAPRLFAEDPDRVMTLGVLTQTANAFGKVFDSLNIISDNWLEINEFRSVIRRLREYEATLVALVDPGAELTEARAGHVATDEWQSI